MLGNLIKKTYQFGSSQKFVVLFGQPGAGKGTYAKFIKKDFGLNHISTGDEIRKILKGNIPASFDKSLVANIKKIVNSGGLIGDDIVINILKEKIKEPASKNGVILDGIPRTIQQLNLYNSLFKTDLVVNIHLNLSVLIEKLMARRNCDTCGQSFNICSINRDGYEMEPLNPPQGGKCEKGVCKIVTRADDTEAVISNRMKEYEEKTAPILTEFKKTKGLVVDFEAKKGVKDYPRLFELIKDRLK